MPDRNKRIVLVSCLAASILTVLFFQRETIYRSLAYRSEARAHGAFTFYVKRAPWLPGRNEYLAQSLCLPCREGDHFACLGRTFVYIRGTRYFVYHEELSERASAYACPCGKCRQ